MAREAEGETILLGLSPGASIVNALHFPLWAGAWTTASAFMGADAVLTCAGTNTVLAFALQFVWIPLSTSFCARLFGSSPLACGSSLPRRRSREALGCKAKGGNLFGLLLGAASEEGSLASL